MNWAMRSSAALSDLLSAIAEKNLSARKPIVVKIAPDLTQDELDQIVTTCQANNVAAIIGRAFSFSVLAQASREQEDAIIRGLDELWQRRIVIKL